MEDTQTQAASSPAEQQDPFNGLEPTHAEFSKWRETGELGERFKPADAAGSAPADDQEKTGSEVQTESAGESETPKAEETQEHRKPKNAAQRIAQLESAIEAEWGKDEPDVVRIGQLNATIDKINGRPKRKSEAAPPQSSQPDQQQSAPQQAPKNFAEWQKAFKPTQWVEEYARQNPSASYEDANFAMAVHVAEQRDQFTRREIAEQQAMSATQQKLDEARERYPDADEVIFPTAQLIHEAKIPPVVKEVIESSDVYMDMCFVIGTDPEEWDKFVALANRNPRAAIVQAVEYERAIKEELAKSGKQPSGTAPEKKKTQAPAPPEPVSRTTSRAFDVNDDSLSDDEWMRKRRAQVASK